MPQDELVSRPVWLPWHASVRAGLMGFARLSRACEVIDTAGRGAAYSKATYRTYVRSSRPPDGSSTRGYSHRTNWLHRPPNTQTKVSTMMTSERRTYRTFESQTCCCHPEAFRNSKQGLE